MDKPCLREERFVIFIIFAPAITGPSYQHGLSLHSTKSVVPASQFISRWFLGLYLGWGGRQVSSKAIINPGKGARMLHIVMESNPSTFNVHIFFKVWKMFLRLQPGAFRSPWGPGLRRVGGNDEVREKTLPAAVSKGAASMQSEKSKAWPPVWFILHVSASPWCPEAPAHTWPGTKGNGMEGDPRCGLGILKPRCCLQNPFTARSSHQARKRGPGTG